MDSPVQIIDQIALFAELPAPTLQALIALAVPINRAAGSTIQLQGEPAEAMYLVAAGRVLFAAGRFAVTVGLIRIASRTASRRSSSHRDRLGKLG